MLGSICFAICAIPGAYEAIKNKACYYSWPMLLLWLAGEILTSIYIMYLGNLILLLNYGVNGICLAILLYYNQGSSLK